MKFSDKSAKEEETKGFLEAFQNALNQIMEGKEGNISYQLTYDCVYRLCKQYKQAAVLLLIQESLQKMLRERMQGISLPSLTSLKQMQQLLADTHEITDRITEVCLFLDVNYCQREKNYSLKKHLNSVVFACITSEAEHVQAWVKEISQKKIHKQFNQVQTFLLKIRSIDDKNQFFDKCFLKCYQPSIQSYYERLSQEIFQNSPLQKYLQWAKQEIENQKEFLQESFLKKSADASVEEIIKTIYACCVEKYKAQIYSKENENMIFNSLSLDILELFRYGRNKDIEEHIEWFMKMILRELNLIEMEDNNNFINCFCKFYQKINSLLKSTHNKFDINYRSVFTFEEWINIQKFNVPVRLNHYINQKLVESHKEKENFHLIEFIRFCTLVFKLMKEKKMFETLYRTFIIERLTTYYDTYDLEQEEKLIFAMEKQCGKEWVQKIENIVDNYKKFKHKVLQQHSEGLKSLKFRPVVVDENDWPYEDRTEKAAIHPDLMLLTKQFEKQSFSQQKAYKLMWSAKLGTALLHIKFLNQAEKDFMMTTDMANIILFLKKNPSFKVNSFLSETGYTIDEVQNSIQKLASAKIIHYEPMAQDYIISLNQNFQSPQSFIDLLSNEEKQKFEVKAMEELKADRKMMVEAILVKIMKAEKTLARDELVEKTAPLLAKKGFNFNADFVSKSIDRLLEKQFIRDFENGNIGYIA